MIVYLDILLIENFIVNFFLLYITIKSLSIEVNYKRLLASSMLGALYVITYFYNFNGILNSLPLKLIIGYLLVAIVLKENTIGIKIKGSILYFLYTVLLHARLLYMDHHKLSALYPVPVPDKSLLYSDTTSTFCPCPVNNCRSTR